jgi:hypothetical protein
VEGGGWRVEGGGWRVEGGGWRAEGGGRRAGKEKVYPVYDDNLFFGKVQQNFPTSRNILKWK